jgi:uncharacterized protein (TIGR02145 family)
MKTLAFFCLIWLLPFFGSKAQDIAPEKLFYQAVYAEQIDGNLIKARTLLEQIVKSKTEDRSLLARSLFRLGMICEKESSKNALSYYTKVVEQYPEQTDLISLVQLRVEKLDDANFFYDSRDGHKYRWVKIGSQVWMAENLAYMPHVNPYQKQENGIWVYDYDGEDVIEARSLENYQKFGCLYDWSAAMDIDSKYVDEPWNGNSEDHRGLCPPGWHLPTDEEWKTMEISLGLTEAMANNTLNRPSEIYLKANPNTKKLVGRYMKSASGWNSNSNGDGSSGLNALPAGGWKSGHQGVGGTSFSDIGYEANFWTATEHHKKSELSGPSINLAWFRGLTNNLNESGDLVTRSVRPKNNGFSVRCLKNDSLLPANLALPTSNYEKIPEFNIIKTSENVPDLRILWDIKKPIRVSSFSKINGAFLFAGSDSVLYAYNFSDQKEIWKRKFQMWFDDETEIVKDDASDRFFFSHTGQVEWIDLKNGETIWNYNSIDLTAGICLDGEFLIGSEKHKDMITGNTRNNCKVFCLDKSTGKPLWEKVFEDHIQTNPVVNGDLIFFGTTENADSIERSSYCFAINKYTGSEVWRFKTSATVNSDIAFWNNQVIASCMDGYVYFLDSATGVKIRRLFVHKSFGNKPVILQNTMYVASTDGYLHSINLNSGTENWRSQVGGFIYENPLTYGNQVIIQNSAGLFGIDAISGKQLWKFQKGYQPFVFDNKILVWTGKEIQLLEIPGN